MLPTVLNRCRHSILQPAPYIPRVLSATPRPGLPSLPVAVGVTIGAGTSLQSFILGRLGEHVGSAQLAATVTIVIAACGFWSLGLLTGAVGRARLRLRSGARLRWWWVVAPVSVPVWLLTVSTAAPKLGIAVLTVAVVCGQTTGGLFIDRLGLSPAGRDEITMQRVLGVVIAIAAVAVGAFGSEGDLQVGLLALVVLAGGMWGLHQAATGHVGRVTGEPLAAGAMSSTIGGSLLIVFVLVSTGGSGPDHGASPLLWTAGGVLAIALMYGVISVVGRLGVLRLMLLIVAGQSVGALVLDLIAPPEGESVTAATLVSLALVFVAVAITGRRRRPEAATATPAAAMRAA